MARPPSAQAGEAMRTVAICATLASLVSAGALAQGTDDARQKLCMLPTYAERMACLDKLAGEAPATTPPPTVGVPSSVPGPPTPAPVLAPPTVAQVQPLRRLGQVDRQRDAIARRLLACPHRHGVLQRRARWRPAACDRVSRRTHRDGDSQRAPDAPRRGPMS